MVCGAIARLSAFAVTWMWGVALVLAAFAAHWGAEQLSEPLKAVRKNTGSPPPRVACWWHWPVRAPT